MRVMAWPSPKEAATSRRMKAVQLKDTRPERSVQRALSALGVRYRQNSVGLPGSPELANQRRRWVIFVHGCFWHRHPRCPKATTPRTNELLWERKFERTKLRDSSAVRALKQAGFEVLVIWECQAPAAEDRLKRWFAKLEKRKP